MQAAGPGEVTGSPFGGPAGSEAQRSDGPGEAARTLGLFPGPACWLRLVVSSPERHTDQVRFPAVCVRDPMILFPHVPGALRAISRWP